MQFRRMVRHLPKTKHLGGYSRIRVAFYIDDKKKKKKGKSLSDGKPEIVDPLIEIYILEYIYIYLFSSF